MSRGAGRHRRSFDAAKKEAEAIFSGQALPLLPGAKESRKKQGHEEDDEQKTLFQKWVPRFLTQHPELKLLHAVPNGGTREAREAKRLVLQGTKAGVPDLDLPVKSYVADHGPEDDAYWIRYTGLRIEMKRRWDKGTPGAVKPPTSIEQRQWLSDLQDAGHCCCVCYGSAQAAESILAYLTGQPVPNQWSRK